MNYKIENGQKKNPRLIAFYLPQFHPIPENDEWWGKGFTEWTNLAKAKPLFRGHYQPIIPSELGFYDLRLPEVRVEQAELAKEYGIEGFCYWHYWFGNGKRLLERPFNEVVNSGSPDFPFCLAWANHSWKGSTWHARGNVKDLLIEQKYPGKEDYINHFMSLLPAFKDKRYIRLDDKLLFLIYFPLESDEIEVFIKTWRLLANEYKLGDFYFVGRDTYSRDKKKLLSIGFDAVYNDNISNIYRPMSLFKKAMYWIQIKILNYPIVIKYKDATKYLITDDEKDETSFPVILPNWDRTARAGRKAIILKDAEPAYFQKLLEKTLDIIKFKKPEKQIVFIKAWNEWAEGNYLEPDLKFGRGYLEAIKNALINFNSQKKL